MLINNENYPLGTLSNVYAYMYTWHPGKEGEQGEKNPWLARLLFCNHRIGMIMMIGWDDEHLLGNGFFSPPIRWEFTTDGNIFCLKSDSAGNQHRNWDRREDDGGWRLVQVRLQLYLHTSCGLSWYMLEVGIPKSNTFYDMFMICVWYFYIFLISINQYSHFPSHEIYHVGWERDSHGEFTQLHQDKQPTFPTYKLGLQPTYELPLNHKSQHKHVI
jgi:hypothetical protein